MKKEVEERAVKMHELKILPEFFGAHLKGIKNFEVRCNDRDYHVGDILFYKNIAQIMGVLENICM